MRITRKKIKSARRAISKNRSVKRLTLAMRKKSGRSRSSGRITVRHRGGGVKKRYRLVDFGQEKMDIKGKVLFIEYDPNRTAFLCLVEYEDNDKRYVLAPEGIVQGEEIICSEKAKIKIGNRVRLENIPAGIDIYNIEMTPGLGGKIVRSAGAAAKILVHEEKYSNLKMPSGEIRKIDKQCFASIGQVSNHLKRFEIKGKAGIRRLKGHRPTVRGTAMNPIDHPHGGGNGKTSTGMKGPETPWGKPARGVRTRKSKWTDKLIIKRRTK